jgi:hypothetical protein
VVLIAVLIVIGNSMGAEKSKPGTKTSKTKPEEEAPAVPGEGPVDKSMIKARKLTGTGDNNLTKTPSYRTSVAKAQMAQPQDWAEITLTYDTHPDWIDELVMRYYAMAVKEVEGVRSYSLYKCAVRYKDIEKGRNHLSSVYLKPAAVKRHGKLVAVGVEVLFDGKVIAELSEESIPFPQGGKWWNNPAVVDSKSVTLREGYLVTRSESPFAMVNIDDYPDTKQ